MQDFDGTNVVIMGAARQGTALAKFMVNQGANVTMTDLRSVDEMIDSQQALSQYDVRWVLGEHPISLIDDADLLCISGGVPFNNPLVKAGQEKGIPVTNDSQIFLEICPCPVIGITGSAGKTTTTSLVGEIALEHVNKEGEKRAVWVGGNIGNPLISDIHEISRTDIVVMELSSFQLEVMTTSPQIAVILNITPNHLDRHGTMDAYTQAKSRILEFQTGENIAILGRDDERAWNLRESVRGSMCSFGLAGSDAFERGSFLRDEQVYIRDETSERKVMPVREIRLRGEHNILNVLAGAAISLEIGCSTETIREAVGNYLGVEHRLEFVRSWGGADWYNDSIATAPERVMAAIMSFDEPIVLLTGGRDKDLPWDAFSKLVGKKVRKVIVFGEAAPDILDVLQIFVTEDRIVSVDDLHAAVEAAARLVKPGDIVLLSPGGTSFDEFRDFAERGEYFRQWVNKLH